MDRPNVVEQRYISLKGAAEYLGVSTKVLYEWAAQKRIPAYKLGRLWRFDLKELDTFVHRSRLVRASHLL